ncbi:NAD+ synthase [Marinospirillum insulare]|uniref:Glutamine-dependent NAD(+) synthetase n=1 Tax=Marinospirillum insulare TaxID=217169 RepID=A0ABQ5ZY36_9GAMM|nr:NAD+ synthase [Marinospirillum insulare]GLR63988.1 NAD+ synthase [Marinospirillum insulare]
MSGLRIYSAQISLLVGDIQANTQAIIQLANSLATSNQADLLLLPELTLTGYPPEDLLLRPALQGRIETGLQQLQEEVQGISLIVGYPRAKNGQLFNAAGVLHQGKWVAEYFKQLLPNEQVFDEERYFTAGQEACVVEINGCKLGILICEDLWQPEPAAATVTAGADVLLALNASPWHEGKQYERLHLAQQHCQALARPLVYCNLVGGQDELLFDGASFALNAAGKVIAQAKALEEDGLLVNLQVSQQGWEASSNASSAIKSWPEDLAYLYGALVLGLKNYVNNSGFKGVVLGMSGGLDSALSAAIAVDALGADRVMGVMMPYHYTAAISIADAEEEARLLGVEYRVIPIAPMVESFMAGLADSFASTTKDATYKDVTEENLQARCRGVLLMALSNKKGLMLLTTGNKSELAVGYCTLYGDMAGGFNAIKDVYKTKAFELCTWRNSQGYVIPQRVIDRPPSAELAPDQKDEDSLPPYPVLDKLLQGYIEEDLSATDLITAGFKQEDVLRVVKLVDMNEYKRRQAAPGTRVTPKAFGKDRRYPLVNKWPVL